MDRLTKKVACPYCGVEIEIEIQKNNEDKIIFCDSDRGGCESYFAAFTRVTVNAEIRRIEGEGI